MRALVSCPGTCGELYQGWSGGICRLISCPIDRRVLLEVVTTVGSGLISVPKDMEKTGEVLGMAVVRWRCGYLDVTVKSLEKLPVSRGYASSTADMVSALFGLAACLGRSISNEEATELAIEVEPSDGVAWPDLVLLDHRAFSDYRVISEVPPMYVVLLDPGGEIDTLEFNRRASPVGDIDYDGILYKLESALARKDWHAVGRSVTASARANQNVLFKPYLDGLVDIAESNGALGVVTAHSGSICGVMYPPGIVPNWKAVPWPEDAGRVSLTRMVPGGARILEVSI